MVRQSSKDETSSSESESSSEEEGGAEAEGAAEEARETHAAAEISALVNYVQPVHFSSFENAESELLPLLSIPPSFEQLPVVAPNSGIKIAWHPYDTLI